MESFFEVLLGIPLSNRIKKSTPLSFRKGGIFGPVTAAFSVTEAQGRGALHAHLAVWGTAFSPNLLQKTSSYPPLANQISKVLDTMFLAMIPKEAHLNQLVNRVNGDKRPRLIYEQSPLTTTKTTDTCESEIPNLMYEKRVHDIIDNLQVHSHRKTCLKGAYGKIGCRLSKPSACTASTSCLELEECDSNAIPREFISECPDIPLTNRDFSINPLPLVDDRCIIWELKRPLIPIIPESDLDLDGTTWSKEDLVQYRQLSPSDQQKVQNALTLRNGSIVEVHDALSSISASNTATYLLGAAEQAKSILFYMLKYMTKDSVSLTNSVTVINDALRNIRQYPSTAEDSGTPMRTTTHFLQRLVNGLVGKIELSAPQAAAHLLNMPSAIRTTNFCYCFVRAAINAVVLRQQSTQLQSSPVLENTITETEEGQDKFQSNNQEFESVFPIAYEKSSKTNKYGSVPVYFINGIPTAIAQDEHYAYRGTDLHALSLCEYTSIISVIKKATNPSEI